LGSFRHRRIALGWHISAFLKRQSGFVLALNGFVWVRFARPAVLAIFQV
jgi:hypothetical protein